MNERIFIKTAGAEADRDFEATIETVRKIYQRESADELMIILTKEKEGDIDATTAIAVLKNNMSAHDGKDDGKAVLNALFSDLFGGEV